MVKGIVAPEQQDGVYNVSEVNRFGDVAYIPGTGPQGRECDECLAMVHSRGAHTYGRCRVVGNLRRIDFSEIKYIDRATPACKYFVERPEGTKPWHGMPNHDRGDMVRAGPAEDAGEAEARQAHVDGAAD